MKKIFSWGVLIFLIVISFLIYWHYFNTYSEGNRSGILQKFSKKGDIFKTYEGELIMTSIASTNNQIISSEKFYFSVNNDSISKVLFDLEGEHITLHYVQKRGHLPWDGETDYFIIGIVRKD